MTKKKSDPIRNLSIVYFQSNDVEELKKVHKLLKDNGFTSHCGDFFVDKDNKVVDFRRYPELLD